MQTPVSWSLRQLGTAKRRALGALVVMLVLAQIGQPYPSTAWLHHLPTLALLFTAPFFLARRSMSDGAVVAVVLFFALHTLGGRYTYSNIPYAEWAAGFGLHIAEERNHYDRLVHFAFGLLFYPAVREYASRHLGASRALAGWCGIGFVISVGALYEILEWLLTLNAPPEVSHDYNGQQGDMWDAQKDMALALLGALGASLWVRFRSRAPADNTG